MLAGRAWLTEYDKGVAISGGWWHPDDYPFEAWERMTYGGVAVGESYKPLVLFHYYDFGKYSNRCHTELK